MNTKFPIKLGAIAFALIATNANATEWTRTLDLTKPDYASELLEGELGATSGAFWIGSSFAFDPRTGLPLSPFALPERLTFDFGVAAISSQRGQLWRKNGFDYDQGFPDAGNNLWGSNDRAGSVTRVPPDGAQSRTWLGRDFGFAGYRVAAVNPLRNEAGALLTLKPEVNGSSIVLRVDSRGRVQQHSEFSAPCAGQTAALDDLHGGYFERCREDDYRFRRIASNPAETWPEAIAFAAPGTRVTEQGGLLHVPQLVGLDDAQYVDPSGEVRYRVVAYKGSATRDGAWFWSESQQQLIRVNAAGSVLATAHVSGVIELVAHENGGVLVRLHDEQSNLDDDFAIHDSHGRLVRRFTKQRNGALPSSRISFNGGQVLASVQPGLTASLVNDDGTAASFAFQDYQKEVRADAGTVCIREYEIVVSDPYDPSDPWWSVPRIRCADRRPGTPGAPALGFTWVNPSRVGSVELLDVASHVRVYSDGQLLHFSKAGALIHSVGLTNAVSIDLHPRQGASVLRRNAVGPARTLLRYTMDGSIRFSRPLTLDQEASVFLAENGDTLLVTHAAPVRMLRFDGSGLLVGERDISSESGAFEAIDAEATSAGVQLLLQAPATVSNGTRRARLLVFSPDMAALRASMALPNAWQGHAALWPATNDDPRVALIGPTGMAVFQVDSRSGDLRNKRLLPIGDSDVIRSSQTQRIYDRRLQQNRYTIDVDGRIRFLDRDTFLKRDVLRISEPAGTRFNGPIAQRALAGSWFSPNSTGQGLLLELLNRNEVLFAAWHTYAPEGGNAHSKQQWFTLNGDIGAARGKITLPIYRNANGRFDLEGSTAAQAVGSAELVFTGCDHLEFWYRIGDETGAFPMQRLTPRTLACDDGTQIVQGTDLPAGIDLSGAWHDPARSGQGFTFNATGARFKSFLAGWFTYDAEGAVDDPDAQHWFTLQGATPDRYGQAIAAKIHRTIGGSRGGAPTQNSHQVGNALLTVHDCATATLEYAFDDSALAGAFANRSRSIALKRLGSCPI